MQLTYLGHAGFIVETRGIKILIDPWFYPAFLESWFPFPDNRVLLPEISHQKFDFLYVSHLHEDHFDRRLLLSLDKSTPVLCPQYRSRAMGKKLASMGFKKLIPLGHKESRTIAPGVEATMLLDTSHKEDSGLLLESDGFRFLDLNDCNTSLTDLPRGIDLLAAQYSGAMWYPNCYDYSPEVMRQKVARVRGDLIASLVKKCLSTEAKAYIPSAGPACFLDPALVEFNNRETTIFPVWADVADAFAASALGTKVLEMHPGDVATTPTLELATCPDQADSTDLAKYSELRRSEWQEFYNGREPAITSDEIEGYFGRLQRRNEHLTKDLYKYIRVIADDKSWGVQIGQMAEDFVIEGEDPYPPEYMLITPPRVLKAILDGNAGWEEALLSMRIRLRRNPDTFDSRFMGLLRYGNEPIQTLQMAREGDAALCEMIHKDGLVFQRFCPHAGEDLSNAIVHDGIIECPRHHWKWNSQTGRCVEGGSLGLRVEQLVGIIGSEKTEARELQV